MQGAALWARLSASHGYFNKQGYCDGGNTLGAPSGNCHLFPVIWGETGTGFTVSPCAPHWPLVGPSVVMQHEGCHLRWCTPSMCQVLTSHVSC